MKILFYILTFSILLNASVLTSKSGDQGVLIEKFRHSVNDVNSIIWRGEYDKISLCRSSISSITEKIQDLEMSQKEKKELKTNLQTYAALVDTITINLQKEAPKLKNRYNSTITGLDIFNKKISSIGLYALSSRWRELSGIKNSFVKKPNPALEKKFENTWNEVVITITELYLDDEVETFLLSYLDDYKLYFKEVKAAYSKAGYENINKLRPLGYKIKAELELL